MNQPLWNQIEKYNLDNPIASYSFSIRLAYENNWSYIFTQKAILEYKKFMYLAATCERMVSPSYIVDIVWHQHLVFTKSYTEFCNILGKKIEHIPSTHSFSEHKMFSNAISYTAKMYNQIFGEQDNIIWNETTMFSIFDNYLFKFSRKNLQIFVYLISCIISLFFCFLYSDFISGINNPNFLIAYYIIFILVFILSEVINRIFLQQFISNLLPNRFLENFSIYDLLYMKTKSLHSVIHAITNKLLLEDYLEINNTRQIEISSDFSKINNPYDYIICEYVKNKEPVYYPELINLIKEKTIFLQIRNFIEEFQNKIEQSRTYIYLLFLKSLISFNLLFILITRFIIGFSHQKPIMFLFITIIITFITIFLYHFRFTSMPFFIIVPSMYKEDIIKTSSNIEEYESHEWNYYTGGESCLYTSFIPLVGYTERRKYSSNNQNSGSCGTCGSSCGGDGCGSCGGCGGCGGD